MLFFNFMLQMENSISELALAPGGEATKTFYAGSREAVDLGENTQTESRSQDDMDADNEITNVVPTGENEDGHEDEKTNPG